MFFAGFFCKRLSKKIIFILKLALTNYQPILMLLYKILCNILNKSLLSSPFSSQYSPSTPFLQEISATCCTFLFYYSLFSPRIQSQHYFYKRFLQHVALFSSKISFSTLIFTLSTVFTRDFCNMLHFSLLNLPRSAKLAAKTQKPPEQGKPASRAIMINFILL